MEQKNRWSTELNKVKSAGVKVVGRGRRMAKKILGFEEAGENSLKNSDTEESLFDIYETDKNKVWAFCSGQASQDFRGNPKYLFLYINNYRKDISAYWLCSNIDTVEAVRALGYRAYQIGTKDAELAIDRTGVLVAEQVKAVLPRGLENVKYLNLFHGVGAKTIERCYTEGGLAMELAKKYIKHNSFYRNNQLFLSTSPMAEADFKRQCGIDDDKFIRAGYPRCLYQKMYQKVETFDHDLRARKGLDKNAKYVVYAPTFRPELAGNTFSQAIPDIEKLIDVCKKNNYLMIFKMHPLMENEAQYLQMKEAYADCPYLYFWDNSDDFYEIIDQIDMGIIDYSSIFTDMMGAGVTHYLRYVFDFGEYEMNLIHDYDEITAGKMCYTFEQLLEEMGDFEGSEVGTELTDIYNRFWEFSCEDTFEKIIERTLEFEPEKREFPTLYSFDIFDTLISRKVLAPVGIFYYVKEKIQKSEVSFPAFLASKYPEIRKNTEENVREYYRKTMIERDDMRREIQFDEIFDRMMQLYNLSEEQIALLKKWELEAELDNVIPLEDNIALVKSYVDNGETVLLISDMYLPKEFIRKMLAKADPMLAEMPLFLSSDLGWQKTNKTLFMEVYRRFCPEYMFGKWIHYGDNVHADRNMPRQMNIKTVLIEKPQFNLYEKELVDQIGTYDAFLAAACMARFRAKHALKKEQFVYEYVALYFVPYINWAIHSAIEKGDEIAYFISRDGYHLKRIADEIIKTEGLKIDTKYIYASRRAWRIPSYISEIDVGFWGGYGNFVKVNSYDRLLKALDMDEKSFGEVFPELKDMDKEAPIEKDDLNRMVSIFRNSKKYVEYIVKKSKEERVSVCGYLKQEIDTERQFSIIEYWGRGYTQECFVRLWQEIVGKDVPVPFYYSRSVLPTQGSCVRYNYTSNPAGQQFIEAIFANIPYKSVEQYEKINGKYEPVIKPLECDLELFRAMELYLVEFAHDFCTCEFSDRASIGRELFDFSLSYFRTNQKDEMFAEILAPLKDSVELYGAKAEYAKQFTMEDLDNIRDGEKRNALTKSADMSVGRATDAVKKRFMEMFQLTEEDNMWNGKKLSESDIQKNNRLLLQADELKSSANILSELYQTEIQTAEVEKKIVLCASGKIENKSSFHKLMQILAEQNEFEVETIELKNSAALLEMTASKFARAMFVIVAENLALLSEISFRKETKLIQLGDSAFPLLCKGRAKKYLLKGNRRLEAMKGQMPVSVVQIPSESMIPVYQKLYNVNLLTDYSLRGCCQTDLYFDEAYEKAVKEKLQKLFPAAKGKKVIFYMPYFRYRQKTCEYMEFLNLEILREKLGEGYVVIMHLQDDARKPHGNTVNIPGFSKDLTGDMLLREQMLAADIVVGDYRDSVFEATLMHKPIFICDRDRDMLSGKETFFDYQEIVPGREVMSEEELADAIHKGDSYDYSAAENFRNKYLTYCDGNSAQRVYEYMKRSI